MKQHQSTDFVNLIRPNDPKSNHDIALFSRLYHQFKSEPSKVDWTQIDDFPPELQRRYEDLPTVIDDEERGKILDQLVVIKLNGGLGTTMGCQKPKSLIPMRFVSDKNGHRHGITFLDFALRQHKQLNLRNIGDDSSAPNDRTPPVPFVLLNSFYTADETAQALAAIEDHSLIDGVVQIEQSRCPRIWFDTLQLVPNEPGERLHDGWTPPGHGNLLESLAFTGMLDRLLSEGRRFAFVSNIDNTAATVDLRIAKAMADGIADYIMEMTPRTEADVKGGTLVWLRDAQRPMHLECPQVPADKIPEFCSLQRFPMFNTNNIWINLDAVRRALPTLCMEILANEKTLLDDDGVPRKIIQLEQSIGGAIRNFPGRALSVIVDRDRFLPVKTTRDLFRVLSPDLYALDEKEFRLKRRQQTPLPTVELSAEFNCVADFCRRIPEMPRIGADIRSIRINGDVVFGRNTCFEGTSIEITGLSETPLILPDKCVVHGNLISSTNQKTINDTKT